MTFRYYVNDSGTGERLEKTREHLGSMFGFDLVESIEAGRIVQRDRLLFEAARLIGETPSQTAGALLHLAAAISHGTSSARALPLPETLTGNAAWRARSDVQFHLSAAGRSLGHAYDALMALARAIKATEDGS